MTGIVPAARLAIPHGYAIDGGGGNRTRALFPPLLPLRGKGAAYQFDHRGFETPCWIWLGCLNSKGYAVRGTKDGRYLVHRRMYEHAVGPIPEGFEVHHRCEQRACVNPSHLLATTSLAHSREFHGGAASAAIIAALDEAPQSRSALRAVVEAAGFNPQSTNAILHRLIGHGEVVRLRRGVYALARRCSAAA